MISLIQHLGGDAVLVFKLLDDTRPVLAQAVLLRGGVRWVLSDHLLLVPHARRL